MSQSKHCERIRFGLSVANTKSKGSTEGSGDISDLPSEMLPTKDRSHLLGKMGYARKAGNLDKKYSIDSWDYSNKDGRASANQSMVNVTSLADISSEKDRFNDKKNCCRQGAVCEHTSLAPAPTQKKTETVSNGNEDIIPPWRSCLILAFAFLFVYTSFEAIQNLQSSLNRDNNLGVASLAVTYLCVIIGSVLGPISARIFGPKRLLQFAFVIHFCYISSNFYPSFALFVPVSGFLGMAIGGLGMSLGLYMAAASNSYVALKGLKSDQRHSILSMFNGVFYSSFKGTHVSGNLISSLILFKSSYNGTEIEDNICGAHVCAEIHNSTVIIEKPDNDVIYLLLFVFLLSNVTGFVILTVGLPKLRVTSDSEEVEQSKTRTNDVVRNLSGCVRSTFSFHFLLLMPIFMAQAMSVMIMYTGYTEAFVTCTIGIQWVGYTMVSLGATAAISSLTVNIIIRYIGRPAVFLLGIVVDVGALVTMLVWVPDRHTMRHLLFVLPAVAGFSEGILQPQFNALIGSVFKTTLPSTYAAFHACKCLAFSISLALSSVGCLHHRLYLALVLYLLGLVGYVVTEIREHRNEISHQIDSKDNHSDGESDISISLHLSRNVGTPRNSDNETDEGDDNALESTMEDRVRQPLIGRTDKT